MVWTSLAEQGMPRHGWVPDPFGQIRESTRTAIEVCNFLALFFLNDRTPQPKTVKEIAHFVHDILAIYLGHGMFRSVTEVLLFSKAVLGRKKGLSVMS